MDGAKRMHNSARRAAWALAAAAALGAGCSDPQAPAPPPCDQACQDGTALRGVREAMKLVFNLTLQGKPVGEHDESFPCPLGGTARVFGTATSNAEQGATEVKLTYELTSCAYLQKDSSPGENYELTLTGTITQNGTIAVQPSATTALILKSDSLTVSGNVYDPPIPFEASACKLDVSQNGNLVSGKMCDRKVGFSF